MELDAPAVVRLEMLVRNTVAVLETQLPYVTLLLRVRGNSEVERAALERRRSFDGLVASLVAKARAGWRRLGGCRPEGYGPAAVRDHQFGR